MGLGGVWERSERRVVCEGSARGLREVWEGAGRGLRRIMKESGRGLGESLGDGLGGILG